MKVILIGLGGGIGAICRYLIGLTLSNSRIQQRLTFPIAMLVVNIIGSLGLGIVMGIYFNLGTEGNLYESSTYLFLGIGFLGAFTTFSTFGLEVIQLSKEKKWLTAISYIVATIIGCIVSFAIGFILISS